MSAEIDSLVLEHLRHIRARVDQIAEDVGDLKHRMTSLEGTMSLVKREVAYGDETDARHQVSLDRLSERIARIERRLDLGDSA
ncbi:MAG: hypothetical protein KFB96_03730 [Thiocapsa sp.]|uniref:hypothetical protein n=1 Tax=Thiocapsa sp. TaxID=2024551 RepID=UPI001BCD7D2F|nr:hypothetical protein [Thiocapsa sp.]QVL49627.1 MAG: hypothetical protein KFB96_03730 [Thiocapsa sp.]